MDTKLTYTNHTQTIKLIDRDGVVLAEKMVDGWDNSEEIARTFDGCENRLYRVSDGVNDFSLETEKLVFSALRYKEITAVYYGETYIGWIEYNRDCDLAE